MACGLLGATLIQCDVGQPPARAGLSLLEFGNTEGSPFGGGSLNQILLQYYLGQPFDTWSFRGRDLVNDANTPTAGDPAFNIQAPTTTTQPFDLTQVPLSLTGAPPSDFVQYRSAHAFWRKPLLPRGLPTTFQEFTQHETLLFARAPEEVFAGMFDLKPIPSSGPTISEQLRADFTTNTWPDAATLIYPPLPNWDTDFHPPGPEAIHAFYSTFDFWQSGTTPSGPGSLPAPNHTGSVKTAMVVDHGLCSQLVPYLDTPTRAGIFPPFATKLFTQAVKTIADQGTTDFSVFLENSDAVSFVHIDDERDTKPFGGFFFGFNAFAMNGALYAQYWHPYTFRLLDGRLTVDPLRDYSSVYLPTLLGDFGGIVANLLDGLLLEGVASPLRPTDLPQTVAATVWHTADQSQAFPGVPGFTCTPDPLFGEKIKVVSDPTVIGSNTCSLFFKARKQELQNALQAGHFGSYIGVPASAFDQMFNDTMAAPTEDGFFFKNVRCAPLVDNGPNQCQMVLPANRINVLPDGVELVFVDDDKEYTNPSFVAWLLLADASNPTLLSRLCDPPQQGSRVAGDLFRPARRAFAHVTTDNKTFTPTNCVPDPTPTNPNHQNCQVLVQ